MASHLVRKVSEQPGKACLVLIAAAIVFPVVATMLGHADAESTTGGGLSDIELLGKYIFFDKISHPERMSCSSCHTPKAGWAFPRSVVNKHQVVARGANPFTVGRRKPPSNAYATFSPPFALLAPPAAAVGGNFWDGRSIGVGGNPIGVHTEVITDSVFPPGYEYPEYLGPTADQALNPFPNHVEQNIQPQAVCREVASAKYVKLWEKVWGEPIDCRDGAYEVNFRRIAVALAAWQDSHEVNSFSSKLDQALAKARAACAPNCPQVPSFPLAGLTEQENRGHDLFYANCAFFCHNSGNPVPQTGGNKTDWENELYTGHGYFNIGTPANLEIPGYDPNNPDLGLFEHTQIFGHEGLHKAPTMRNVDLRPSKSFVKAYTHNGWFKSLKSLVHFYNTRDVLDPCPEGITTEKQALKHNCWPKPEVAENVFTTAGPPFSFGIGDMGLSDEDEDAIVAYLKTLTDRYTPKAPKPYK